MSPQPSSSHRSFGVVLLAAGASRRMGRPKLLLPWGQGTVLSHLARLWQGLGAAQVLVVIPPSLSELEQAMGELASPGLNHIVNPQPQRGMFSSVQSAAAWPGWLPELTHWILSLGDQPHVREATLRGLVEEGRRHPGDVVQPARNGRGRHPVWMPAGWFRMLPVAASSHLKAFLAEHARQRRLVEMDDAGLDLDMDCPEDYEAALRLVAAMGEENA